MTVPSFIVLAAEVVESGNKFEQITRTFGVHWSLFISQLVSFLIVCFVLKKFAYGPIMEMLEKRRTRIADGEAKLAEIEQKLADSEKTTAELIAKANDDAKRLISEARDGASAYTEQKSQEAVNQAQAIIAKAHDASKAEHAQMANDLKKEFGRLVVAATAQVSGKVLTPEDQARINQEAAASVQN
ncbi:MAG: F0F1 ATP synthase subunit B [Verrucomicrobiaceae bacterium]